MSLIGSRATSRRVLISSQVALTLVLLTAAAAFIETLRHLQTESVGFQTESVIDAQLVPLPRTFADNAEIGLGVTEVFRRHSAADQIVGRAWYVQAVFTDVGDGHIQAVRLLQFGCVLVKRQVIQPPALDKALIQGRAWSRAHLANALQAMLIN